MTDRTLGLLDRVKLFSLFASLDMLLYLNYGGVDLRHDLFAMCVAGVMSLLVLRPPPRYTVNRTQSFARFFTTLTTAEIVFAILVPWGFVLYGYASAVRRHLFAFQTQVMMEGFFLATPYELFVYTVLANAYRGWVVLQWLAQTNTASMDRVLASITLGLWVCSTFLFVPFYWFPNLVAQTNKPKL